MPKAMKIKDLKGQDGQPLDLSVPAVRENDQDEDYPSDPPTFAIMSIAQLQEWKAGGMKVPEGSHNAGHEAVHTSRSIIHPDDPLGLVAGTPGACWPSPAEILRANPQCVCITRSTRASDRERALFPGGQAP